MKRSIMLGIFSVGIGVYCLLPYLWFALTSLKSPLELTAISTETDSFISLGFLSFGARGTRAAPLHRQ